jgi:hypothetical protein
VRFAIHTHSSSIMECFLKSYMRLDYETSQNLRFSQFVEFHLHLYHNREEGPQCETGDPERDFQET